MTDYYLGAHPDHETSSAMPPPWVSAWAPNRGWPTRPPPARVGPLPYRAPVRRLPAWRPAAGPLLRARAAPAARRIRGLGALGQWEDPAWEDMDAWSYEPPPSVELPTVDWSEPSPGPVDDWWNEPEPERPPPEDAPEVHEIVRPGILDVSTWLPEPGEFSTEAIEQAVATLIPPLPQRPDGAPGWFEQTATKTVQGLVAAVPALLKGLFPGGVPPVWTPCENIPGTYWTGKGCAPKPSSCPQGTYWTGTACAPVGIVQRIFGGGEAGGAEGGGGFALPQWPMTTQGWFWPVVIGGGVLVLIVSTRRR